VLGGREMPNPHRIDESHPAYLPLARAALLEQVVLRPLDQGDALLDPLQINHAVRFEAERRRLVYARGRNDEEPDQPPAVRFLGAHARDPRTLPMPALCLALEASVPDERTSVCFLAHGHWTTVAVHRGCVDFFDPTGGAPEPWIRAIMQRVGRALGARQRRTVHRYQRGGNECGVYAIAFALGDHAFCRDAEMFEARKRYFVFDA
jgi:hypothetical protein